MAKDSSFDIVSETNMAEVENAFNNATKELRQRYDLKDSNAKLELDKQAGTVTITAPSDFVCGQVQDILSTHLVRRKVDLGSISWGKSVEASGGALRIVGSCVQGIAAETAKQINKDIKAQKFKAKVQIEGDKLRVSSPKKDELQAVIAFVKENDYGLPLQFVNYR